MERLTVYTNNVKGMASAIFSQISGVEEFAYLLGKALFHYGPLIGNGMYEHATVHPVDGTLRQSGKKTPDVSRSTYLGHVHLSGLLA
jgi:hypothetical protein